MAAEYCPTPDAPGRGLGLPWAPFLVAYSSVALLVLVLTTWALHRHDLKRRPADG